MFWAYSSAVEPRSYTPVAVGSIPTAPILFGSLLFQRLQTAAKPAILIEMPFLANASTRSSVFSGKRLLLFFCVFILGSALTIAVFVKRTSPAPLHASMSRPIFSERLSLRSVSYALHLIQIPTQPPLAKTQPAGSKEKPAQESARPLKKGKMQKQKKQPAPTQNKVKNPVSVTPPKEKSTQEQTAPKGVQEQNVPQKEAKDVGINPPKATPVEPPQAPKESLVAIPGPSAVPAPAKADSVKPGMHIQKGTCNAWPPKPFPKLSSLAELREEYNCRKAAIVSATTSFNRTETALSIEAAEREDRVAVEQKNKSSAIFIKQRGKRLEDLETWMRSEFARLQASKK